MFIVRDYAIALAFVTPLVLIIISSSTGPHGAIPSALIVERVVDTVVGAALGAASGVLHPRWLSPEYASSPRRRRPGSGM